MASIASLKSFFSPLSSSPLLFILSKVSFTSANLSRATFFTFNARVSDSNWVIPEIVMRTESYCSSERPLSANSISRSTSGMSIPASVSVFRSSRALFRSTPYLSFRKRLSCSSLLLLNISRKDSTELKSPSALALIAPSICSQRSSNFLPVSFSRSRRDLFEFSIL